MGFLQIVAHGKVDDKQAAACEVGCAGETYLRIRIASLFGNMLVLVSDGHLPYPFGHETTGTAPLHETDCLVPNRNGSGTPTTGVLGFYANNLLRHRQLYGFH